MYDPAMPLGVGEEFAGYTIVGRLGAGGMGEVYLAQHPRLPRRDALKVLSAGTPADATYRERFLREADAAAKLWHPHIVGVHDRGDCDGRLWISMDYVDGEDAGSLLSRRYPAGMPADLVAPIVTSVAAALDYAHRHGVLHRDVKPANIMLAHFDDPAERRILLTDFGIARDMRDVSGLTETNMTLGTFAYSAPEQLMGGSIDGRADQYALAATAYHLLSGAAPFPGTSPAAVIGCHLNSQPPRLSDVRPELEALDPVLAAALAKEPESRFASCSDFAAALTEQTAGSAVLPMSAPTAHAPAVSSRAPSANSTPARAHTPAEEATARSGGIGRSVLIAMGLVALVFAGLIGFLFSRTNAGETRPSASEPPVVRPTVAGHQGSSSLDPEPTTVTETATRTVSRPPDTVTAAPPPARPAPTRSAPSGDLGLSVPMSFPPCNGLGIVIVYSATNPDKYRLAVQQALSSNPGSLYLRTDRSCPSLRQSSDRGDPIYAVFYPAGYSKAEVCAVVRQMGEGAYGRWLDTATSPNHKIVC